MFTTPEEPVQSQDIADMAKPQNPHVVNAFASKGPPEEIHTCAEWTIAIFGIVQIQIALNLGVYIVLIELSIKVNIVPNILLFGLVAAPFIASGSIAVVWGWFHKTKKTLVATLVLSSISTIAAFCLTFYSIRHLNDNEPKGRDTEIWNAFIVIFKLPALILPALIVTTTSVILAGKLLCSTTQTLEGAPPQEQGAQSTRSKLPANEVKKGRS